MSQYAPLASAEPSNRQKEAAVGTSNRQKEAAVPLVPSSTQSSSSNRQKEVPPVSSRPTGLNTNANGPMLTRRIPLKGAVLTVIILGYLFCLIEGGGFNAWSTQLFFTGNQKLSRAIAATCFSLGSIALFIGSTLLLLGLVKGKNKFYLGHMLAVGIAVGLKLVTIIVLVVGASTTYCSFGNPSFYTVTKDGQLLEGAHKYYGVQAAQKYAMMKYSDEDEMMEYPKDDWTSYSTEEMYKHFCMLFRLQVAFMILFEIFLVPVQAAFVFVSFSARKFKDQF